MKRLIKKKKHIDSVEAYWCAGCPNTPCTCSTCGSVCTCSPGPFTAAGNPNSVAGGMILYQSVNDSNFDNMHGSGRDWAAEP